MKLRRIAIALAVLLAALGAAAFYLLGTYDPPPVDPAWAVAASAEIPAGAVTVRWTGTDDARVLRRRDHLDDRRLVLAPGTAALLLGKIAPDVDAIERGLARNGVDEQLAAVFPVHSHYDHAMDAPEVARRTGALLLGSESTANIGARLGARRAPDPRGARSRADPASASS